MNTSSSLPKDFVTWAHEHGLPTSRTDRYHEKYLALYGAYVDAHEQAPDPLKGLQGYVSKSSAQPATSALPVAAPLPAVGTFILEPLDFANALTNSGRDIRMTYADGKAFLAELNKILQTKAALLSLRPVEVTAEDVLNHSLIHPNSSYGEAKAMAKKLNATLSTPNNS